MDGQVSSARRLQFPQANLVVTLRKISKGNRFLLLPGAAWPELPEPLQRHPSHSPREPRAHGHPQSRRLSSRHGPVGWGLRCGLVLQWSFWDGKSSRREKGELGGVTQAACPCLFPAAAWAVPQAQGSRVYLELFIQ